MKISVVIPVFNNWQLTRKCVQAIHRTTNADLIADLIVVDDASTDAESAAWITAQRDIFPVILTKNRGFSGACNAGARVASGDAILFLNNDAFAQPGALKTLRDTLLLNADVGIVGARLLYADQTLQHAGLALLPGPVSRWWHVHKRHPASLPDANVARDYLAVTGAALLIRRELFTTLRGFDEGFINGWEDVDLCLRVWCAGFHVRYEPRAVLEHLESATLGHSRNHESNERRFVARWQHVLVDAPRYPLPSVPPIALAALRSAERDPDESRALAHVHTWWNAHLGAAVMRIRPASSLGRARVDIAAALARRRPTLEISWGDAAFARPTGQQRVAFVAPVTRLQAQSFAAAQEVTEWWTPSDRSRSTLIDVGCPADSVITVRLGAVPEPPTKRTGPPRIVAMECDHDLISQLTYRFPSIETLVMSDFKRTPFAEADVFVVRGSGDPWGMTLPAALGCGCIVVASPPVDTIATAAGCIVVAEAHLLSTVAEHIANIDDVRARAMDRYMDARRTLDAYLATQFVAERVRSIAGGTPSAISVAVDPTLAVRLQESRASASIILA